MDLELLKSTLIKLFQRGFEKEKIQRLFNYLVNEGSTSQFLFYPIQLAEHLQFSREEILKLVTYGVLDGLFEMSWQTSCPQCQAINFETSSIRNLHRVEDCPMCGTHYEPEGDRNVQVVLSLHPRFFDEPVAKETDRSLKQLDPESKPLTLLELVAYPDFREHFTDQIPRLNQGIKIRSASIMFTDLINSTQLYEKIGDVQAFLLVNEHFEILFEAIIKKYGGVIKTIGDAVMAVFKDSLWALKAGLEIKQSIDNFLKSRLNAFTTGIKIGLHSGPAVVVNLNDTFDLFGSTVNKAARLVSHGSYGAIAVSNEFFEQSKTFLRQFSLKKVTQKEVVLKGIAGREKVYLLYLPE